MAEVKHGGCFLCGSKEYPILTARAAPNLKGCGAALCPKCEERYEREGPQILLETGGGKK